MAHILPDPRRVKTHPLRHPGAVDLPFGYDQIAAYPHARLFDCRVWMRRPPCRTGPLGRRGGTAPSAVRENTARLRCADTVPADLLFDSCVVQRIRPVLVGHYHVRQGDQVLREWLCWAGTAWASLCANRIFAITAFTGPGITPCSIVARPFFVQRNRTRTRSTTFRAQIRADNRLLAECSNSSGDHNPPGLLCCECDLKKTCCKSSNWPCTRRGRFSNSGGVGRVSKQLDCETVRPCGLNVRGSFIVWFQGRRRVAVRGERDSSVAWWRT